MRLSPDGRTLYLISNKDRDLPLSHGRLDQEGQPGPIEVLAARDDGELAGGAMNEQGTLVALLWNIAGRSELSFYDTVTGKTKAGPKLPAEIAGAPEFSDAGRRLDDFAGASFCERLGSRPRAQNSSLNSLKVRTLA